MHRMRDLLWKLPQKLSAFTQPKRLLYSSSPPFDINAIYEQLLNQPLANNSPPIACNFASQILDQWEQEPGRIALQCIDQKGYQTKSTYRELIRLSHKIAHFFEKKGLKKGDAVALMLGQHPVWWHSIAGLIRQGIAVVPLSRLLTSKDLRYRINDLEIRGIIATPECQARIDLIRSECPTLTTAVTTGAASHHWHSLTDIDNCEKAEQHVTTTTADPCIYLFTSGTTGQPKAVIHHHDYPFFHWPTGKLWLGATSDDLIYNASDTGWGFTVWITAAAWTTGATLLITPTDQKFDPQKMLTTLRDEPISIFCASPSTLRELVRQKNFNDFLFPHLKKIITVGEALDETIINLFHARGTQIYYGFGQAETPLLIARLEGQPHVPGTMGKPIAPYKIVILDDDLKPLPAGHLGQIAVDLEDKRYGLMRGYVNAPDRTKSVFPGRYYLTGDWGILQPDGSLTYHSRKDDSIKSRGYRIGPHEVEEAGMSHPAVGKIAVVGVRTDPDSLAFTVKAFILLKLGYTESPALIKNIQDHIKKETAPNKYPRLMEFLSEEQWRSFETTSGKISRAALRKYEEEQLKSVKASETSYSLRPS